MSNNIASSSNLAIAQKAVKQLRLEASVRRIKVSQAAADLKTFLTTPSGPQNPAPSYEAQYSLLAHPRPVLSKKVPLHNPC
ncbi:hypothetical protein AAFF_G00179320 [Aldrovandia affinis]|uniref:Guanine nucleotide-binding protein subunit gamma n=1 Tax=Aldrovandia affinis TaxID=143900 RepID=A0AAD7RN31_9TELE|nr:hypothetical protein AAFF_G00179320 [Aldrovandia affinis]